jgi:hypothetical protein
MRKESLRSRKVYARKPRRAREQKQPNYVGISEVTLAQEINLPLPQGSDGLETENDPRVPPTPTGVSQISPSGGAMRVSDVTASADTQKILLVFQPTHTSITSNGLASTDSGRPQATKDAPMPTDINHTLRRIYFETYFEFAYIWCPTIDQDLLQLHPEFASSVLLNHSLAVVGTNLKPPLLQHTPSIEHYRMARNAFYTQNETNPLITICALMLFHYWDMSNMQTVNNTDTDWWWLGNAIRLAQGEGLHREGKSNDPQGPLQSLKRRIWWSLFVSASFPGTLGR